MCRGEFKEEFTIEGDLKEGVLKGILKEKLREVGWRWRFVSREGLKRGMG